ncbi:MAG: efflux RND transporter permease subunit [Elusimicrobia bacterium]|nr:efflux RND transporter permease subunit [Elusimicrobiota bacterium]
MSVLEKILAYFVNRHLLTNLMFLAVFLAGLIAYRNIRKEEMPDIAFDFVRVSASYPGASAEQVEHFVTKPFEEQVRGLDGVYRVTSTSSEGSARVSVELEQDYPDKEQAIMDIRNAVLDAKLPDEVRDEPKIRVFKTSKRAIIDICLYDASRHLLDLASRKRLQEYAYSLETQLSNLPQVNSVNKSGYLKEEIRIMLDPAKLRKFDIPFSRVMQEVKANHIRQPAGNIEAMREPKVTLLSELDTSAKLNDLIVQGGFEGQAVRLKEVAAVFEGFEKNRSITKVNGHEAIILNVVKNSSSGILDSINAVHKMVKAFKSNIKGASIEIITLDDESFDLKNRLSLIVINGSIGFVLILILLFSFLNFKSGFWVALGLPFTILFTLAGMTLIGYTINNITLAAVILVMGMVVDDAIVVAENISRLSSKGMAPEEAAIKGTGMVFMPIVASIVTTCVAFSALFFFEGRFAKMNKYIPAVIFLMLGASLFESLFILPSHMRFEIPLIKRLAGRFRKTKEAAKRHWFEAVEDVYEKILLRVLRFKSLVFLGFILLALFSAYIAKSKMKFVMFPREETREILITGEGEASSDRYATARLTTLVENIIKPYIGKEAVGFRTQIARSRHGGAVQENRFRISVEIVTKEDRKKSADDIIGEWQKGVSGLTGINNIKFSKSRWGQSSGSPIEVVVQENDNSLRQEVSSRLAEEMKKHGSLENVEIEQPLEVPEYKISLNREKIKRLSINSADISATIRAALQGTILYTLTGGDEEIDVRFTCIEAAKDNIEEILDIPIGNRGDYLVPLRDIVSVKSVNTPNSIERKEGKRITRIFSDIRKNSGKTPMDIAEYFEARVFPEILGKYPTSLINFEGEVQDTRESKGDFIVAIVFIIVLMYFILVLFFGSLVRPLFIMATIPFGVIGVIIAFWLHGKLLFGFFAAIGVLGLSGVVINDSIILIDKLDNNYDGSKDKKESIFQISSIAKTRLKAVTLTTLTTVAGLFPTAYGLAGYDAMLAEMMLALAWGLIFGTLITLVIVPCIYGASKDFQFLFERDLNEKNAV